LQNFEKRLLAASVFPPVRRPVRMELLCSLWTDFYAIWYLNIFRKSLEKIQDLLKPDKNNGYFTWRAMYIFDHISLSSS